MASSIITLGHEELLIDSIVGWLLDIAHADEHFEETISEQVNSWLNFFLWVVGLDSRRDNRDFKSLSADGVSRADQSDIDVRLSFKLLLWKDDLN